MTVSNNEEAPAKHLALPLLHGEHVYLRAIEPEDYPFLHRLETSGELGPRWRFRGSTPAREQWAHAISSSLLAQFIVVGKQRNDPVGLVVAYQANFQDGYAQLAAAKFNPASKSPLLFLGLAIFLEYVFACWNLRKLYMEVPEYSYPAFESGEGRFFTIEGRFRDHSYLGGRYWDQLVLAIRRELWANTRRAFVRVQEP